MERRLFVGESKAQLMDSLGGPSKIFGFAMVHRPDSDRYRPTKLEIVAPHPSHDVCIGRFAGHDWQCQSLPLPTSELPIGEDVQGFGFVSPTRGAGGEYYNEIRFAKGHVALVLSERNPWTRSVAYELSFDVPRGLSGAPLLAHSNVGAHQEPHENGHPAGPRIGVSREVEV